MSAKKNFRYPGGHGLRQRKSHKKSRSGCTNCRFRRVKCDEGKPACHKCRIYMVPCSYDSDTENLQLTGEALDIELGLANSSESSSYESASPILLLKYNPVGPLGSESNHDVILRFQRRTALTMGTEHTNHIYAEVVPRLAMQHEDLLHAVLAITIMHDRALAGSPRPTTAECYHLSNSASLYSQKLSSTINDKDRDALWATAVYLCAIAVFKIDISDPEEAWPLRPSHPADLEWLNMQAGLKVIWDLAHLSRAGGMFSYIENNSKVNCVYPDLPNSGIAGIPQILVDLCNLTTESTASTNPYHAAIQHLSRLLPMEGNPDNILSFMVFAGGMTNGFRKLLRQKDPRGLLILAIWYSKLFHSTWWMSSRARIECQAICRYLDRLNIQSGVFEVILEIVKMACSSFDSHGAETLLEKPATITQRIHGSKTQNPIPDAPTSKRIDIFWDA